MSSDVSEVSTGRGEGMLVGKKLVLRPVEEQDLSLLVKWRNTPSIRHWFFNRYPLSVSGQKAWYENLIADQRRQMFAICPKPEMKPVGTLSLDDIDFVNQSAELGNVLIGESEIEGKGYASEAVRLLLAHAFLQLNMHRIHLKMYADNTRARQLYEACGFLAEGTLRDAQYCDGVYKDILVMGMLRPEFPPSSGDG